MFQSFLKSWHSNRGNLLVLLASIAGSLMCLVWYFQLLPDVQLLSREVPNTRFAQLRASDRHLFVATLKFPEMRRMDPSDDEPELRGFVELYSPEGTLGPEVELQLSRSLVIDSTGPLAVVISDASPGEYAVVCYIDLNDNGKLDYDDNNQPAEPFRTSGEPKQVTENLDLAESIFSIKSGKTAVLEFDFR